MLHTDGSHWIFGITYTLIARGAQDSGLYGAIDDPVRKRGIRTSLTFYIRLLVLSNNLIARGKTDSGLYVTSDDPVSKRGGIRMSHLILTFLN
jgi:hypothetical protein